MVQTNHAHTCVFVMLTILIRIEARSILLFGLWTFRSWETVTNSQGGSSCLVGGALLCNSYQDPEGGCGWPYMGTVNNSNNMVCANSCYIGVVIISNKTWHMSSVLGWVQSPITIIHGMCSVK